MIACLKCGTNTRVYSSFHEGSIAFRYRICPSCAYRFRTFEEIDKGGFRKGEEEFPANRDKSASPG